MDHEYSINLFYMREIPKPYSNAFVTINILIALLVVLLNSLLCYAIQKLKLLQKISYRFILSLAVSDLCTGLIVQPLYTLEFANTFRGSHFAQEFQVIMQFLAFALGQYSGLMVVVISIDRYLHMRHLSNYNIFMTSQRAKFMILFSIGLSTALGIIQTASIFVGLYVHVRIFTLTANVVVSFAAISFYMRAFLTTKNRVESLHLSSNASFPTTGNIRRADFQFAKGVLIIIISLSLCYFPYFLTGILLSFKIMQTNSRLSIGSSLHLIYYFTMLLVFMVPLINAAILCIFNRTVRRYFRSLLVR